MPIWKEIVMTTGTVKFFNETKGFGFVEMDNDAEASAAIDGLNGTELDGRTIVVNKARPRDRF